MQCSLVAVATEMVADFGTSSTAQKTDYRVYNGENSSYSSELKPEFLICSTDYLLTNNGISKPSEEVYSSHLGEWSKMNQSQMSRKISKPQAVILSINLPKNSQINTD